MMITRRKRREIELGITGNLPVVVEDQEEIEVMKCFLLVSILNIIDKIPVVPSFSPLFQKISSDHRVPGRTFCKMKEDAVKKCPHHPPHSPKLECPLGLAKLLYQYFVADYASSAVLKIPQEGGQTLTLHTSASTDERQYYWSALKLDDKVRSFDQSLRVEITGKLSYYFL